MDEKKVNLKVIEQVSSEKLERLVGGLRKIEGFEFLVDSQATVKSQNHQS